MVVVEEEVAEEFGVGGQAGGDYACSSGLEEHRARHADEGEEVKQGLVLAPVVPRDARGVLSLLVGEPRAHSGLHRVRHLDRRGVTGED